MSILYTPDVVNLSANDKKPLFDKAKFDAAIAWLHAQKGYDAKMLNEEPATDLIRETVNIFHDAMDEGIATAVIPPAMEAKLRENVFLFSACKTHQQLTQASALLLNDVGRIKPFEQFAREVTAIHADYNINYLNAEYNFAVSSSQMASKWMEAEADGDRYNLQYRTADDALVRESHRLLHNTTLPASDPFWDSYYPPNGWGCRCNTVQVLKSKYETSDPEKAMENGLTSTQQIVAGVDKGAIFRFNPGKSQQIFPPKHPYYKMPAADKAEVDKIVKDIAPNYFVPAKTLNDAKKRFNEIGFQEIDFSVATIEQTNVILEACANVAGKNKLNIGQLKFMTGIKSSGRSKGGVAGVFHFSENTTERVLAININNFKVNHHKKLLSFNDEIGIRKSRIEKAKNDIEIYSGKLGSNNPTAEKFYKQEIKREKTRISDYEYQIEHISRKIKNGESPIPDNVSCLLEDAKGQIQNIVYHELGHYVDYTTKRTDFNSGSKDVSIYGQTDSREYFAEWFSYYKSFGDKNTPLDLLNIFKEWENN